MSFLSLPRRNPHDTVNVEFQLSVIKPTTGINSNQICCQELPVQDQGVARSRTRLNSKIETTDKKRGLKSKIITTCYY